MVPKPRARARPDGRSGTTDARALKAAESELPADDIRASTPLSREVNDALWEGAALIAVDSANIDRRIRIEPGHAASAMTKQFTKPLAPVASQDQLLKADLLANDSLGG